MSDYRLGTIPTDQKSGCYSQHELSQTTLLAIMPEGHFRDKLLALPTDQWHVASFNTTARIACVEVNSGSRINVISINIPEATAK